MNVLIIDNEPENIILLEKMLIKTLGGYTIRTATSAKEGIEITRIFKPQLVLLDIEMPEGSGFDFLNALEPYSFQVIFVTGHKKYALEAIKNRPFDYLLKPVSFESLNKALLKLSAQKGIQNEAVNMSQKISINTLTETIFVSLKDLVRVSAAGSYCIYHLSDGREIVASHILKQATANLPKSVFFRVHNSHILNLYCVDKIVKTEGLEIRLKDGASLPFSRRKKETFTAAMENLPEQRFY